MTFSGALMWQWKDKIDRKFMDRLNDLPTMAAPPLPKIHAVGLSEILADAPLCGGCGAKVGRGVLRDVLQSLPGNERCDVSALPGDDAALLHVGAVNQVLTSDHLRRITEDPVVMARIAVNHALGDIWAMGAAPQAATATVILPRISPDLQRRTLDEIMTTAAEAMREAGAEIVGGHTSIGDEMTIGFSVTGLLERDPITLAGGRPGDALILTKPLGSGIIMAAEMAGRAKGAWVAAAFQDMTISQSGAAQVLSSAHAMTDVTGFGLAGHLLGLCEASGTGAAIDLEAIPLMSGALALHDAGVRSSLYPDNRAIAPYLPEAGKAGILFDPQTAGGLLAAVAADEADGLVNQLVSRGYKAARMGQLVSGSAQLSLEAGLQLETNASISPAAPSSPSRSSVLA
jgi:selenide,water dikinase